jgi:NAD+ synthase (glutamine-hydrolysing)
MRLALAQVNLTVGAFDRNFARMREVVAQARAGGADLVVFPELAATGYPPRDLLNHRGFIDRNLAQVDRVAALATGPLAVLLGFVDRNPSSEGKALYNAAAFCADGRVVARRQKTLLPTYDVFDEDRYFEPAHEVAPIDWRGARLGVTICEDVWNDRDFWPVRRYHRDPVSELAAAGVDVLLNISASPFTLHKPALRREMVRQEAVKHARYFFYLNQVGGDDELVFDGHSIGIDPAGGEVVRARDFEEDLVVYDVPLARWGEHEAGTPVLRAVSASDEEAAYRALVLGLRDYVYKCGFADAVVGLSGGIDSSLTACLAAAALGPEHVLGVAMPSRYSSAHSLRDAAALASNLGLSYRVIPIDGLFQAHLGALAPVFAGRPEDVTEENLQARIRGTILMSLSNKFGSLVLATGNKSELAVGYCTLYGDMCGGFAAISDVPKLLVYRLARFANRDRELIPDTVFTKAPSAELRPDQKDTDTLPPFDVLDPIMEAYVEENCDIDTIVARGFDPAVVQDVVRRIDASEYKRRQAAPGIKISSSAFGIGRRYPLAAESQARRSPS